MIIIMIDLIITTTTRNDTCTQHVTMSQHVGTHVHCHSMCKYIAHLGLTALGKTHAYM